MSANEKWPDPTWSIPPYVGQPPQFQQTTLDPSLHQVITIVQAQPAPPPVVPPFVAPVPTTWNTADATAGSFTLSNSNANVAHTVTEWSAIRTSDANTSGLLYCEFQVVVAGSSPGLNYCIGLADNGGPAFSGTGNYCVLDANGGSIFTNGSMVAGVGNLTQVLPPLGLVVGIAINYTTGKFWVSENNSFVGSGNPAAGTNPQGTFTPGQSLSPVLWMHDNAQNGTWQVNATLYNQKYAPPSGFTYWDSKSIFFRSLSSISTPSLLIPNGGFSWNAWVCNAFSVDPLDAISGTTYSYTENSADATTYGSISEWFSTNGVVGPYSSNPANPILVANPGSWENSYLTSPWPITIGGVKRIYYSARNASSQITIGQAKWNGSAWVKWASNPIFPSTSGLGDPCVLGPFGSTYYMFVANAYPNGSSQLYYTSTDGDNWSFGGTALAAPASTDWDFTQSGWFEFYPFLNRYGFIEAFYITIDSMGHQHAGYCISPAPNLPFKRFGSEISIPFPGSAGNVTLRETASYLYVFLDYFNTLDFTQGSVGVTTLPL